MSDPRRARLASDEAGLRELAAGSQGTVTIERSEGSPAVRYEVVLRCRGATHVHGGQAWFSEVHRVEIGIGARYPLAAPEVRFLTPIFNPHVFPDGRVCLGARTGMTERLADLVLRLGGLIQYDPALIDESSPANREALGFARAHWANLPFGQETFRRARLHEPSVMRWTER